jgi:hypothetical protein
VCILPLCYWPWICIFTQHSIISVPSVVAGLKPFTLRVRDECSVTMLHDILVLTMFLCPCTSSSGWIWTLYFGWWGEPLCYHTTFIYLGAREAAGLKPLTSEGRGESAPPCLVLFLNHFHISQHQRQQLDLNPLFRMLSWVFYHCATAPTPLSISPFYIICCSCSQTLGLNRKRQVFCHCAIITVGGRSVRFASMYFLR